MLMHISDVPGMWIFFVYNLLGHNSTAKFNKYRIFLTKLRFLLVADNVILKVFHTIHIFHMEISAQLL